MQYWMQIIKEATVGTTPTADADNSIWIDLGTTDPGIVYTPEITEIKSALPRRGVTSRFAVSTRGSVSGSLTTGLYHEQADFWNAVTLSQTIGGSAPYPASIPTVTINTGWTDDGGTARYEQYKRCIIPTYSLSGSNTQDPINLTVSVVGGQYNGGATIAPPACSNFPVELYLWNMTTLELNDTQIENYLLSWTIAGNHTITPRRHINKYPDTFHYGGFAPSLNVSLDMFSHAYRTQYLDIETAFADAIYSTNNKLELTYAVDKKVTFNLYDVMFRSLTPSRTPGQPHTQSATIVPFYDCTNLDMTCTITNPA